MGLRRDLAMRWDSRPMRSDQHACALGHRAAGGFGEPGVGSQPGNEAASQAMHLRPPGIIIISHIKHIGGAGLNLESLGRSDVVDVVRRHVGLERHCLIGVVNDVQLGGAMVCTEARPVGAEPRQLDLGGIDDAGGIANGAPGRPVGRGRHMGEQIGEQGPWPPCIGIAQG